MADPVSLAITVALNAAVMGMTMMQKIEGPRLDDLSVSTADYGTPLPNIHGAMRVECICFYAEKIREEKHTSKTKGGKYAEYKYFGTWASLLADHQIDDLLRVWIDRRLAFDKTTGGPVSVGSPVAIMFFDSNGVAKIGHSSDGNFRVYFGTEDQPVDPRMLATITAEEGPGMCPAYLGVAYMFFEEVPLEKFGNRLPQVGAEPMRGPGTNPYPYYSTDGLLHLINSGLSPDKKRLITTDNSGGGFGHIQCWDMVNHRLVIASDAGLTVNGHDLAVVSGTEFYAVSGGLKLWLCDIYGGVSQVSGSPVGPAWEASFVGGCTLAAGEVFILPAISTWHEYSDSEGHKYTPPFAPTCFFGSVEGDAWVVGPVGSGGDVGIGVAPGNASWTTIHTGSNNQCGAMDNGYGQFFVLQSNGHAYLVDKSTGLITHTSSAVSTTGNVDWDLRRDFSVIEPGSGVVWVGFEKWNTKTGELVEVINPFNWKVEGSSWTIFSPFDDSILSYSPFSSTDATWRFLDRNQSDGVTLGSICEIVGLLAGFQLGDYDFTDLDQIVPGYLWTQGSAKDVVGALLEIYDSDIRPHGFIQQGLKRGQPQSGPPISSDFMVRAEEKDAVLYTIPVGSETDLPRRVFCTFADPALDDQPNTAIAQRNQSAVVTTREVSFDLTTMRSTPDLIQPLLDRALRRQWIGATKPECTVSPLEIKLEPGDVRILSFDSELLRCRCTRTKIRANRAIDTQWEVDGETPVGTIDWETDDFASLSVLFDHPGGTTNGRPPDTILVPMETLGFVLDTGLLTDADNSSTPFVYVAAAPVSAGFWPGTGVWSSDFGDDDSYVAGWETFTSDQEATFGYIGGSGLGNAATDSIDEGTVLVVNLPNGETLTSITTDAMLADPTLNLAVVGNEVIQFRDADLITSDPRQYHCTGLIRGARGTEWAVSEHTSGEKFLLITSNVRRHMMGATELGDTDYYKFSTLGDDLDTAPVITVAFAGNANRPLSPAHLSLVRDTVTGDWSITWLRRTRIGGGTVNGQDVPLGETSELYRVKIMNGSSVLASYDVTTNSKTYTAAQQTTDWGSPQTSLTVEVVQVSPLLSLEGFTATASA